jgi:hypothetical protein
LQLEARASALSAFVNDGVSVVRRVIAAETISFVVQAFADAAGKPGRRGFAPTTAVRALIVDGGALGDIAAFFAARAMKPVRVLFFDKTVETNWAVPWHQDRTIAVRERVDTPGFGAWNLKEGVIHVEPPVSLLENMLTLRLFLDDCDASNGPLEIACNTHNIGRIPSQNAPAVARGSRRFVALGKAGDVLAMRLLCLHKSDRAAEPSRRRVLHVDYAGADLAAPLHWAERLD